MTPDLFTAAAWTNMMGFCKPEPDGILEVVKLRIFCSRVDICCVRVMTEQKQRPYCCRAVTFKIKRGHGEQT